MSVLQKKTRFVCQMAECSAKVSYRCIPTKGEGFSTVWVCERHMPHFRDKDYKIEGAKEIGKW